MIYTATNQFQKKIKNICQFFRPNRGITERFNLLLIFTELQYQQTLKLYVEVITTISSLKCNFIDFFYYVVS